MGVGAICSLVVLLALASGVAWCARRVDHEVQATEAAVQRLRRVRLAIDLLRGQATATRAALDDTGDSFGHRGRR